MSLAILPGNAIIDSETWNSDTESDIDMNNTEIEFPNHDIIDKVLVYEDICNWICSVHFTPGWKWMLFLNGNSEIDVIRVSSGHTGLLNIESSLIRISESASLIASVSNDFIYVHQMREKENRLRSRYVRRCAIPTNTNFFMHTYSSLRFDPSDQLLAVGTAFGTITLYNTSNGDIVKTLPFHAARVTELLFMRNGNLLSLCIDGSVVQWETVSVTTTYKVLVAGGPYDPLEQTKYAVSLCVDVNETFIGVHRTNSVSIYTINGNLVSTMQLGDVPATSVFYTNPLICFSDDAALVFALTHTNILTVWKIDGTNVYTHHLYYNSIPSIHQFQNRLAVVENYSVVIREWTWDGTVFAFSNQQYKKQPVVLKSKSGTDDLCVIEEDMVVTVTNKSKKLEVTHPLFTFASTFESKLMGVRVETGLGVLFGVRVGDKCDIIQLPFTDPYKPETLFQLDNFRDNERVKLAYRNGQVWSVVVKKIHEIPFESVIVLRQGKDEVCIFAEKDVIANSAVFSRNTMLLARIYHADGERCSWDTRICITNLDSLEEVNVIRYEGFTNNLVFVDDTVFVVSTSRGMFRAYNAGTGEILFACYMGHIGNLSVSLNPSAIVCTNDNGVFTTNYTYEKENNTFQLL